LDIIKLFLIDFIGKILRKNSVMPLSNNLLVRGITMEREDIKTDMALSLLQNSHIVLGREYQI